MGRPNLVVLIADDDVHVQQSVSDALKGLSQRILTADTAKETWRIISESAPDVVLLDIHFPDSKDLSLLARIKEEHPEIEILVISGDTSTAKVVQSIKSGAYDYVSKPFIREELRNRVAHMLELQRIRKSQQTLLEELDCKNGLSALIGETDEIKQVRAMIKKVADGKSNVLIHGESGTGKELAARALHFGSERKENPFVTVNAAAIPESLTEGTLFGHRRGAFTGAVDNSKGVFEQAQDGTLFLDEIGDMPHAQQAALLRAIENRRYKPVGDNTERQTYARFVFATNQNLKARIQAKQFREDLYYRMSGVSIQMPPLRVRFGDIPLLVQHFAYQLTSSMGRPQVHVRQDVIRCFQHYAWPGNIRELRNVLETAIMLSDPRADELTLENIPAGITQPAENSPEFGISNVLRQNELKEITRVLQLCNGNQCQAAAILGIHRNTLRKKIRDNHIVVRSE